MNMFSTIGAEKQKAKALNYRPEEFHKEALPLLAKLLRNNISVVSKDEVGRYIFIFVCSH